MQGWVNLIAFKQSQNLNGKWLFNRLARHRWGSQALPKGRSLMCKGRAGRAHLLLKCREPIKPFLEPLAV